MSKRKQSFKEKSSKKTKKPCGLTLLPYELLSTVFVLSSNSELPTTCRALYQQLYYCHNNLKISFLLHRCKYKSKNLLEEASRFQFFNRALVENIDQFAQRKLTFSKKKIPSRLFMEETNKEHEELIALLLERGGDPNRPEGFPIFKSVSSGRVHLVKLLISYGATPQIKNNRALKACVARNNFEMVNYLLDELKVEPDSDTLGVCVKKNLWDMFQVLVDHGAVPDMNTISIT
ncbi:hypothetical protein BY458DRAFT_517012 [Sporodiniella umbellata]|nr:hypothetical protein BY458DRAFT_517012 [Sporodiniella umbellata]